MKTQKEIHTAWEIWILINRLNDLLWERYEEDFADIDPYEQQDPCLGPLGPLGVIGAQDKYEATPTAGRTFQRRNKRAPLHNNSERSLGYGWVSLLEWKRDKGGSIKDVHHILANDLVARLFPS